MPFGEKKAKYSYLTNCSNYVKGKYCRILKRNIINLKKEIYGSK
jgi:hypothetical protein